MDSESPRVEREPTTPSPPAKRPDEVTNKANSLPTDAIKEAIDIGATAYKKYHECEAARQQTMALKSLNEQLPGLLSDTRKFLKSNTGRNHAINGSVRQIADRFEGIGNAPFNGASTIQQNVKSIKAGASSSSKSVSEAATSVEKSAQETIPEVHGVRFMAQSLSISVVAITVIMVQLLEQVKEVNRNLAGIREELWRNNVLISSGGSYKNGFAEVVYNFVNMEAGRAQYGNDCFFVWHPDTSWHPAFYARVKDTPLPATFQGESDCLDKLCIAMKAMRQGMKQQGKDTNDITFHVLIPSWYNITLTDPVYFPDELLPLRLVGPKHDGGKPLVSFVLPRVQRALTLQGVGNLFEEKLLDQNTAEIVGTATEMSSFLGAGAAGAVLADMAIVGLGIAASPWAILVAAPLFWGGGAAGFCAGNSMRQCIIDNWSNKRPRVLGSHRLLSLEEKALVD